MLAKLHVVLFPKLGVMKMFSAVMSSVLIYLGKLKLQSIEVEVIARAIHYLISLCIAESVTKLL